MKTCIKCHTEKSIDKFQKRKTSLDGYRGDCYECMGKYNREWAANNRKRIHDYWKNLYSKNRDKLIEKNKQYLQTSSGKAVALRSTKKWQLANKFKKKTQDAFQTQVKLGKIIPWPKCAVPDCNKNPEGHHPDYSQPYDVVWLCRQHHHDAHKLARP